MSILKYSTALVIVLPDDCHETINHLRAQYDHAYPRWMPHITLYYPFVPIEQFEDVSERLRNTLSGFGTFNVNLNQISFFRQKQKSTIHLRAEDETSLQRLFQQIHQTLPEISLSRSRFIPHVTLGQATFANNAAMIQTFEEYFQTRPLSFSISEIQLIHRSETDLNVPFSVYSTISLV